VKIVAFCFLSTGVAKAASNLAEAEEAFTEIMCGEAHCGPAVTLSHSMSPNIRFGGLPKDRSRLIGAVYEVICEKMEADERLRGICGFAREVSVGMSPQVKRDTACLIDYSFPMIPRPLALHPEINVAEIQSCIVWAGLSHVLTNSGATLGFCAEDELGLLEALVATNAEFQKVLFGLKELSNPHRLALNNVFLSQSQKDKREIRLRREQCPNLKEEDI